MSFLLKVISFPSQTEQSSGPRRLGNLFHKTDSLASIQSLSTPQPRRTNKSFSDAAPDTLRCMFHCFIPASVLLASCSKKKKGAESTSRNMTRPVRMWNSSIIISFGSCRKMSTSDTLFQRLDLALLLKRPIHLGHHRPFCCPVLSASSHVT